MAWEFIRIGQNVRFDPFETTLGFGIDDLRKETEGTVVEIYWEHKWFSVEFGEPKQRTSFNFADIGKTVMLGG